MVAELQCQLNSQFFQIYHVKVKPLVGQKWGFETRKKDIWLDPDEAEKLEPLSHAEVFLSVEIACLPCLRITTFPVLEKPLMTSPRIFVMQGDAPSF